MILYHQTSVKLVGKILKQGLIPRMPNEYQGFVAERVSAGTLPVIWFTDSIRPLGSYLHSAKCLILVDTNSLDVRRLISLNLSNRGWWAYEGSIQPDVIRLVNWREYRKHRPVWYPPGY